MKLLDELREMCDGACVAEDAPMCPACRMVLHLEDERIVDSAVTTLIHRNVRSDTHSIRDIAKIVVDTVKEAV